MDKNGWKKGNFGGYCHYAVLSDGYFFTRYFACFLKYDVISTLKLIEKVSC